jgi:cytochrome c biogenesis factor
MMMMMIMMVVVVVVEKTRRRRRRRRRMTVLLLMMTMVMILQPQVLACNYGEKSEAVSTQRAVEGPIRSFRANLDWRLRYQTHDERADHGTDWAHHQRHSLMSSLRKSRVIIVVL